jgi:predicted nucleic acid-binding protein
VRIFLDANVLFSAAKSDGAIRALLTRLHSLGHELWVDGYVMEEARRNLAAKFPPSLPALTAIGGKLTVAPFSVSDLSAVSALNLPPKDQPVLAAAIRHGCDVLVTGDRTHFGFLYERTLHGVTIRSPSSLAAAVGKRA